MPQPGKGETQQKFISRCIPIVLDEGTAKDNKQAAAICYSIWRRSKGIKKSELEELKGYLEELKDIVPEKTVEKEESTEPIEEKEETPSELKVNDTITYKGRTGKIVEIIE